MSNLKIDIDLDNAAFDHPVPELCRILSELIDSLKGRDIMAGDIAKIRDVNGNAVGTVVFS